MNMGWLYHLVLIFSLSLTVFGEQTIELLNLCETSQDIAKASSQNELPIAVSLNNEDLNEVSSNILSAETWLRSNVFPFYPSSKITNIVGKTSAFCQQNNNLIVVLSALKNLYHSLTRWGLEKNIKVSIAFHLHCFTLNSPTQTHDFKMLKHMTHFLQTVNSTISLIPPHSDFSDKNLNLVTTHLESMKKFGFFNLNNIINVVSNVPKERKKTITRKLSVTTIPIRPTPFPEIAEPPLDFPVGYPIPSNFPTTKPLPPLAQVVSSPPPIFSPNFAPQNPPNPHFVSPASSPHYGFNYPPCNPRDSDSPSPQIVPVQKLWCVAKPSVPEETLQQALDYACGEGGADCLEITTPEGNCYYPDTLVSHASYAFNSYWQKHKINGGTCNFGGTAMLINSDPSFLHCRFILS